MIRLHQVTKVFGQDDAAVKALNGVELVLAQGSVTAVMGPSGCGKSTLLTVMGGLQAPDEGSVEIVGVDLAKLTPRQLCDHRRDHIGFVFQDYNLLGMLSVVENVALPLELAGVATKRADKRAREALSVVGLDGFSHRLPASLSGGQAQRAAIARAIVGGPRVILADEPTGALDSKSATQVLDVVSTLGEAGSTIVMVTHDRDVASRAERIVHMRDGHIVNEDST